MMKLKRVIVIIYCSVILNSLVSFVFGDKGCFEYGSLQNYKKTLEANIAKIIDKNKALTDSLGILTTSKEKVTILARELGYYRNRETPIILDGFSPRGDFYEIGNIVTRGAKTGDRNPILRIIVVCITGCAIILDAVFYQRRKNGNQRY